MYTLKIQDREAVKGLFREEKGVFYKERKMC